MKNLQDITAITCELYPTDDLANGWEFKSLLDHFDEVKDYFDNFNFSVPYTVDIVADYFIVDKICAWDFAARITPEYKEKYNEIKAYFETIKSKYEIKKVVDFLKSYSFIADDENRIGFTFRLYDILPQYVSSIKDEGVFVRAINANPYLILDSFSKYKKVFKRYNSLYYVLFSEDNIKELLDCRFDEFAKEASVICKEKDFADVSLKEQLIGKFVALADAIIDNKDVEQALINQVRYKTILLFLKSVSHPQYAEYLEKKKQVDDLSEKWLDKNNQQFSFDIPLDGVKKQLDDPSIPWILKYIQLTNSREHGKWKHFSVEAMEKGKNSITELITIANIDINSHFVFMTQQILSVYQYLYGFALLYFIRDLEKWKSFAQYTYTLLHYTYNKLSIPIDNIISEFVVWTNNGVKYLFYETDNELEKKDIAFTFTDKTVKFTERILRTVYSEEMKLHKKFYDPDKITLKNILDSRDETNPLIEILSVELMQYLSFCLIQDEDNKGNKVGIDLRNLLEHDKYDLDNFDNNNGVLSLLVLVSVINGFYLYYSRK